MAQPLRLDSSNESEESAQRFITRACDTCRTKKICCELVADTCAQCTKSKISCHFTPTSVLRRRRRLSRDRRVEEIEKRLAMMEGQLSAQLKGRQFPRALESVADPKAQYITGFNEYHPVCVGSQAFDGHSLGAPPAEFQQSARISQIFDMTAQSQQRRTFGQNISSIDEEKPIFQKLPSKSKALRLITLSFQGFNAVHPIFNQDTFMSKFDSTYGVDCYASDPGWWAALNVMLALAYHYHDIPVLDSDDDLNAWGYFQNALAATDTLITRNYTLASVQALLGMSMILMAMPEQRPISVLISSAIKIAQNLGLHRQDQYQVLNAVESAERIQVFWVAYSLDQDISLQTRQPPTQSDEDMDIEPPSENDYIPVQTEGIYQNLFYFRTRLSIIQGQIYRRLLSVQAGKQSTSNRAIAAKELETSLQAWKYRVPIEIFCDCSGPDLNGSPVDGSPPRYPVYLQLLYFKSLAVIHETLSIFPLYQEIQSSQAKVHVMSIQVRHPVEARSAIRLLNVTPRRKFACIWTALHIFVTAGTTLLMHAISNPSNALVRADRTLLEPFLGLLGVLARSSGKVEKTYQSSMIFFEQARAAVEKSGPEKKIHQYMGDEDPGARESLKDFLERMEYIRSGDSL